MMSDAKISKTNRCGHHNQPALPGNVNNQSTCLVVLRFIAGWWLVDCDGDIGWVPASFMQPTAGGTNNNDDDIITESFPPGRGRISLIISLYDRNGITEKPRRGVYNKLLTLALSLILYFVL